MAAARELVDHPILTAAGDGKFKAVSIQEIVTRACTRHPDPVLVGFLDEAVRALETTVDNVHQKDVARRLRTELLKLAMAGYTA